MPPRRSATGPEPAFGLGAWVRSEEGDHGLVGPGQGIILGDGLPELLDQQAVVGLAVEEGRRLVGRGRIGAGGIGDRRHGLSGRTGYIRVQIGGGGRGLPAI